MGCTPAQACWRYMAKHLADLRNKIDANDFSDREDWLEKCQDAINYFRFLWCIANDNGSMYMLEPEVDAEGNVHSTIIPECKYAGYVHPYGDRVCFGTRDKDLCPGYRNCDSYKPEENNKKEND